MPPRENRLHLKAVVCLIGLLVGLLPGAAPLRAGEHHVALDGDDANPGTPDRPWRTISHAARVSGPGDVVLIHEGVYSERVVIEVSGDETAGPVVFRSAAGEHAVIDGTGLPVPPDSSGLVEMHSRSWITAQEIEIRNLVTADDAAVPVGVLVTGSGRGITLTRLDVHDIRNTAQSTQANAHGILFSGNLGIAPLERIRIDGCTVRDLELGASEALVLNGNVRDFRVEGCTVHDVNNIGIDLIGFEGVAPANDQAREGLVADNVVYHVSSLGNPAYPPGEQSAAGIYCDGCRDVVIERNLVHHANMGVEVGAENTGSLVSGVIVRDNLLRHNDVTGIAVGGYDTAAGLVRDCVFRNNTLFENDTAVTQTGEIRIEKTANLLFEHNILHTTAQAIAYTNWFPEADSSGNTMRRNLVRAPAGAPAVVVWHEVEYPSIPDFRAATGQEQGTLTDDPRFAGPGLDPPDLHPAPESPAVDAGTPGFEPPPDETDLDGFERIVGQAIDLGAYEQPTVPCPAPPSGSPRLDVLAGAGSDAELRWSRLVDADAWDVERGDLGTLATGSGVAGSADSCLAAAQRRRSLLDDGPGPTNRWFLVRGRNCLGPGTWDDDGPGLASSRDPALAGLPATCP